MSTRTPKSRYRVVYTSMWGEARFRRLSRLRPSAQALWLYLTTGPHTTSLDGLFSAGEGGLADSLGWGLEDFRACWRELDQAGMAKADWEARVVWLPGALTAGEPANHKVVLGWWSAVADIPECDLTTAACASIVEQCRGRARECAAHSPDPSKTMGEWESAIRRTFGAAAAGQSVRSGAPPDTPPDTVSDTVCDTRNRNRNTNKKEPPPTPSQGDGGEEGGDSSPSSKEEEGPEAAAPRHDDVTRDGGVTASEREGSADEDELARHYDSTVKPQHTGVQGAREAILRRLREGETPERLRRAADAYAADLDAGGKDARYRQTARTFYGEERGKYLHYRDRPTPAKVDASPEAVETARKLVAYYRATVDSAHGDAGAVDAVLALLAQGTEEEALRAACRVYRDHCNAKRLKADARKGAPKFFAGGKWKAFAAGPKPPPVRSHGLPPPVVLTPAEHAEMVARIDADRERRKGGGVSAATPANGARG